MRRITLLLLAFGAALAQEDPRARARELEVEAEKALDEGRRADALKLLAEAAELRAGARGAAADRVPLEPKTPEPAKESAPAAAEGARTGVDPALREMDVALGKGDAAAALKAGLRAREALEARARDIEARERRLRGSEASVEERLSKLEAQVEELKKLAAR
jgi:hypothetical protein